MTHWGAMLASVFLIVLLHQRGIIDSDAIGPISMLIVGLAYVLGALHLDRILWAPGLLMFGGFFELLTVERYAWTIVGALVAIGLVAGSLAGGRSRAA